MFEKTISHFKAIASIPHCSFETSALGEYIKEHAKKCDFMIKTDNAGNILCKKGSPKVCLQAHYDMVCMGDAPKIDLFEEQGWLKATNSSLGADNGMGLSMMLALMESVENLECLFTNDEEVGLLGAENLQIRIESENLLNLDSEEEQDVVIGCAGGVDIFGSIECELNQSEKELNVYELEVSGLDGGHSGVDIAKNVPNALKVLANILAHNESKLVSIEGGERNNSIAQRAKAKILCEKLPVYEGSLKDFVSIKDLGSKQKTYLANSDKLIHAINSFSQGVREYDEELKIPILSINLSTLKNIDDKMVLEFFARSMDDEKLENIKSEMSSLLHGFGFDVRFAAQTSSWKPVKSDFALSVKEVCSKHIQNVKLHAIHAGLECGVIMKKQPHIKGVCSIGPTIMYPHSVREKCLLSSVEKIVKVVEEIVKKG